jgi:hypothetical protein
MSAESEPDYFQLTIKCYDTSGLRRTMFAKNSFTLHFVSITACVFLYGNYHFAV